MPGLMQPTRDTEGVRNQRVSGLACLGIHGLGMRMSVIARIPPADDGHPCTVRYRDVRMRAYAANSRWLATVNPNIRGNVPAGPCTDNLVARREQTQGEARRNAGLALTAHNQPLY